MKRAFPLLGLLACLSAGAQSPVSPTPFATPPSALSAQAATASGAQQFTLANGMQLIVQPDRRAPTAMHMVWLRVGSMDEVDGTSGVAHVLEHMMFKGTKTVPPGEFSRRVAALGGQENAFTSRDYTGYYQQIPAHRLEDVMRLESDRFAHNQWPDDEFKREIEVVKEERRLRTEDQPRALLAEQLFATTFMASPYRRPVVGWMSDLDALTPEDVCAFVADALGLAAPEATEPLEDVEPSPALRMIGETWPIDGRVVAILTGDEVDAAELSAVRHAVDTAGALPLVLAPHGGLLGEIPVQRTPFTAASIEFDALVALAPSEDARVVRLVDEISRQGKAIGAVEDAGGLLASAGVATDAPGVVVGTATEVTAGVLDALAAHRAWERVAG